MAKPIVFTLNKEQLSQIGTYTDKPEIMVQAHVVDNGDGSGTVSLHHIIVDGQYLALNRYTLPLRR